MTLGPIFNMLNTALSFRYRAENRRLLAFGRGLFFTFVYTAIEELSVSPCYFDASKCDTASPQLAGYIVAHLLCIVWLMYINFGQSIFGVANRIVFKATMREIIDLRRKKFKTDFLPIIYNILFGGAIALCFCGATIVVLVATQQESVHKDSRFLPSAYVMLQNFYLYGIIFRIVPFSFAVLFGLQAATHVAN